LTDIGGTVTEKKQAYEKPVLRKVRLEVKTSVLAACHVSGEVTPALTGPCSGENYCFEGP
jgi:hypothetical protein